MGWIAGYTYVRAIDMTDDVTVGDHFAVQFWDHTVTYNTVHAAWLGIYTHSVLGPLLTLEGDALDDPTANILKQATTAPGHQPYCLLADVCPGAG